jgi:hypothetical protein
VVEQAGAAPPVGPVARTWTPVGRVLARTLRDARVEHPDGAELVAGDLDGRRLTARHAAGELTL